MGVMTTWAGIADPFNSSQILAYMIAHFFFFPKQFQILHGLGATTILIILSPEMLGFSVYCVS